MLINRMLSIFRPIRVFVDMDGTLAKWQKVSEEALYEKGYFENLAPDEDMCEIVWDLYSLGLCEVHILSCYLPDSEYAYQEKLAWVKKHLPDGIDVILVPYGTSKAKMIKELTGIGLSKKDILVDDHSPNCIDWENHGGKSIKYLNEINGSGRSSWSGKRAEKLDLIYDLNDILFGRA